MNVFDRISKILKTEYVDVRLALPFDQPLLILPSFSLFAISFDNTVSSLGVRLRTNVPEIRSNQELDQV